MILVLVHRKDHQIIAGACHKTASHRFQLDLDAGGPLDVCFGDGYVGGKLCGVGTVVFDGDICGPGGPGLVDGVRNGDLGTHKGSSVYGNVQFLARVNVERRRITRAAKGIKNQWYEM